MMHKLIIAVLFHIAVLRANTLPILSPEETVNKQTGEMSFTLELGTVEGVSGFDYPITISYKAGIRLHEKASPVGLGFSYGPGSITRQEVHMPDNSKDGFSEICDFYAKPKGCLVSPEKPWYEVSWNKLEHLLGFKHGPIDQAYGLEVWEGIEQYNTGGNVPKYMSDITNANYGLGHFYGGANELDDLPDIYIVNTPWANGRIRDALGKVEDSPHNLNFCRTDGSIITKFVEYYPELEKWEITLSDGTRLIFDQDVRSTSYTDFYFHDKDNSDCYNYGVSYQKKRICSSWLLTKVLHNNYVDGSEPADDDPSNSIESNKGAWIRFEYERVRDKIGIAGMPQTEVAQISPTMIAEREGTWAQVIEEVILKEVLTPNQSAHFYYDWAGRKDELWFHPTGEHKPIKRPVLDKIRIKSHQRLLPYQGPPTTQRAWKDNLRIIDFTTDYELRPNHLHSFAYSEDLKKYNRVDGNPSAACLTLKEINISVIDEENSYPPIRFNYGKNPDGWDPRKKVSFNSHTIPNIDAFLEPRDYWGYYSANSGSKNDFNIEGDYQRAKDADAWSLKSVDFPNGLSIEWAYEPHRYTKINHVKAKEDGGTKYGGGIRVKEMKVKPNSDAQPVTMHYSYIDGQTFSEDPLSEDADGKSSGHATAEPIPYLATEDPRTPAEQGGLYTSAKIVYEKVKVAKELDDVSGETPFGFTVFLGYTPADFPNSLDGANNTIDGSWGRGMMKSVEKYDSQGDLISRSTWDYEMVSRSEGGAVDKPTAEFGWAKLMRHDVVRDNVAISTAYTYEGDYTSGGHTFDLDGQPSQVQIYRNAGNAREVQKTIEYTPAFMEYPDLAAKRMFAQRCQTKVFDGDSKPISASVTTWMEMPFSGRIGQGKTKYWTPKATYKWKSHTNHTAWPVEHDFDFSTNGSNAAEVWQEASEIDRVDIYGRTLTTKTPSGFGIKTSESTMMGKYGMLPMATIQNASADECAIFTCDYAEEKFIGYAYTFDFLNGWKTGSMSYFLSSYSMLDDEKPHFGDYSIRVLNHAGPTCLVSASKKDYFFAAWVYPLGKARVHLGVEPIDANGNILTAALGRVYEEPIPGQWNHLVHEINAEDVPGEAVAFQINVGIDPDAIVPGLEEAMTCFVDDIRFHPADAMVQTHYHDRIHWKLRTIVDSNCEPGLVVSYDPMGRPQKWERLNAVTMQKTVIRERDYHLAGTATASAQTD